MAPCYSVFCPESRSDASSGTHPQRTKMAKKTIADLTDLRGKRVLIRVDFNVPQDATGKITNDRRIRAALPTLKQVLDTGASAIVMSHLGRPKGDPKKDAVFRMDQVAER